MNLFEELSIESGIKEDTIKAWGADVRLRSLNASEIIEYHEDCETTSTDDKKVQGVILLVHTLLGDGGSQEGRILKADRAKFVKLLLTKDFRTVQSLVRRARELNGLELTTPAKAEVAIKND